MHILKDGKPYAVDIEKDAELLRDWCSDLENRRVGFNRLRAGLILSTVFLVVDHGWSGIPQWFESMVLTSGFGNDLECRRYETIEQARRGHRELLAIWGKKKKRQLKKLMKRNASRWDRLERRLKDEGLARKYMKAQAIRNRVEIGGFTLSRMLKVNKPDPEAAKLLGGS